MFIYSPATFNGTIADFYARYVVPSLPSLEIVAHCHRLLMDYCRTDAPIFIVRQVKPLERGAIYVTNTGAKLKASDNSPAWWLHAMMREERTFTPATFEQAILTMPTHIFQVKKHVKQTINDFGWHIAHAYNAKNGDTNYRAWDRDELARRFIKNIHPYNCFYIAKSAWQLYGGNPTIVAFFAERYAERYGAIWNEFRAFVQGNTLATHIPAGEILYSYGSQTSVRIAASHEIALRVSVVSPSVEYEAGQLTFKAKQLEPLRWDESFRISTPIHTFQMTKAEFYRVFDNEVGSLTYQLKGTYSYSKPPSKALQFLIATQANSAV